MARLVTVTFGAALVSAVMVSAQSGSKSATASDAVVFRGCLALGSGEGNFVLSKATEKGQKGKEKVALKVTAASDKVKLEPFVLKEVEITGTLGAATDSGSASLSEGGEVLRSLTATKVVWKSDYCG